MLVLANMHAMLLFLLVALAGATSNSFVQIRVDPQPQGKKDPAKVGYWSKSFSILWGKVRKEDPTSTPRERLPEFDGWTVTGDVSKDDVSKKYLVIKKAGTDDGYRLKVGKTSLLGWEEADYRTTSGEIFQSGDTFSHWARPRIAFSPAPCQGFFSVLDKVLWNWSGGGRHGRKSLCPPRFAVGSKQGGSDGREHL